MVMEALGKMICTLVSEGLLCGFSTGTGNDGEIDIDKIH
jgi:hypothetical protein